MREIKRKRVENSVERRLAIGMIVSKKVCREVSAIYNPDLIEIPYVRVLAGWCLEYFKQYDQPPLHHITDLYHARVRKEAIGEEEAELIAAFLEEISGEYERADKFNADYLLDQIEERFKIRSLQMLSEDIQAEISQGAVLEAEARVAKYNRVSRTKVGAINPYTNAEAIQEAFEKAPEPLFTFPGAFGEMVNDQLIRGNLIGMMGRAKIGKTWTLMEVGYRSTMSRCNVAWFSVGDMDQDQMIVREHIRLSGRSNLKKYCGEMWVPVMDCLKNQDGSCTGRNRAGSVALDGVDNPEETPKGYIPCAYCAKKHLNHYRGAIWYIKSPACAPLTWREALKAGKKLTSWTRGKDFRLSTHPNTTISVAGIEDVLDTWEHFDGWIPDVIIIDYADILAPEPESKGQEERNIQNDRWKALRRLSQKRHMLVITATQSDAESYDAFSLKLKHFSEDRRKYDHVNGMLALNQTEEEKQLGYMRVGWLLLRQGEFDANEQCAVLQCLQKGQSHIGSFRYIKSKSKPKDEKKE